MNTLRYTLLFQPEPEGGFTVIVPALPGCVTYGSTYDEAMSMADDAIRVYLESLAEDGEEIPAPDADNLISTINVKVSPQIFSHVQTA